ncbi:MAG: hypothetical protein ABL955_07760 [Elusimicrobiota bacterium]
MRRGFVAIRAGLLTALVLLLSLGAGASEPVSSTASVRAPRPPENPWALTYGLDRRGDRYGRVDYRLRWSLEDLSGGRREHSSGPGVPFEATFRGLMKGMGVDVYGVRLRPFRDLALNAPLPAAYVATSTAAASGTAAPASAHGLRLYSWERFYEDLESSAHREAEGFLVREGFNRALPAYRAAPYSQKRALGSGLLGLTQSWDPPQSTTR